VAFDGHISSSQPYDRVMRLVVWHFISFYLSIPLKRIQSYFAAAANSSSSSSRILPFFFQFTEYVLGLVIFYFFRPVSSSVFFVSIEQEFQSLTVQCRLGSWVAAAADLQNWGNRIREIGLEGMNHRRHIFVSISVVSKIFHHNQLSGEGR
jgi:hypothetical protein